LVAVAPASAAPAAARLGTRFVDRQRPTAVLLAGETGDRGLCLVVISVLDEAEALRPASVPVGDDGYGIDVSVLRKEIAKVVFARIVGKVTDIKLHRNRSSTRRLISDSVAPLGGADFPRDSSDFLRARNACEEGERYEKAGSLADGLGKGKGARRVPQRAERDGPHRGPSIGR